MSTTNHHVSNGRRPNLGDQINRLDKILDGLSDGLNEAIAGAVRDTVGAAVKEAVQAVLIEMMSRPELLHKLRSPQSEEKKAEDAQATPANETQSPARGCFQRVGRFLGELRQGCNRCLKTSGSLASHLWNACMRPIYGAMTWCNEMRQERGRSIFLATVAIAIGTIAWFASPWIRANAGAIADYLASALADYCTEQPPRRRHRTC